MICYAFIGIQGSGKGTQAVRISKQLNYQHINIGNLFRSHINHKSSIGILVHEIIQRGELVSDDIVFELIEQSTLPSVKGIIFDGFPRTIAQAEYLIFKYELSKVFFLELKEDVAMGRIVARRICKKCHEDYNLISQPPNVPDTCDYCSGELVIREDDKPEAIRKRFRDFHEQTLPLRNFFTEQALISIIDANQSVETIYQEIINQLKKH